MRKKTVFKKRGNIVKISKLWWEKNMIQLQFGWFLGSGSVVNVQTEDVVCTEKRISQRFQNKHLSERVWIILVRLKSGE